MIGGWYDGYRDSVPRMLEHMDAPVKAMVGPWAHSLPHSGYPKPQMEWRHEAVRWYDQWLKGEDTGIMDEPAFAVYVRNWYPPDVSLEEIPGEWRFEESFPLERTEYRDMFLGADNSLGEGAPRAGTHSLEYDPTVGMEGGGPVMWWGDLTPDQQPMDDASLVYDSAPLDEEVEILGFPRAFLNASADAPLASWVVRLSDIAPDGSVTQVAGAGFNGAHRDSSQTPEALEPGREYAFEIELHFTSWVFQPGHRIRVAVTNSQWPMFWPTPYAMTTSLRLGGESATHMVLPVIPYKDRPAPEFLPPAARGPRLPGYGRLAAAEGEPTTSGYAEVEGLVYDEETGKATLVATNSGGTQYPGRRPIRRRRSPTRRTSTIRPTLPCVPSTRGRSSSTIASYSSRRSSISTPTSRTSTTSTRAGSSRTASCCVRRPGTRRFRENFTELRQAGIIREPVAFFGFCWSISSRPIERTGEIDSKGERWPDARALETRPDRDWTPAGWRVSAPRLATVELIAVCTERVRVRPIAINSHRRHRGA